MAGRTLLHHFWLLTSWDIEQIDGPALLARHHERGTAEGTGTPGAFKAPSLRNVSLTGPYMPNAAWRRWRRWFLFGFGPSDQAVADLAAFLESPTDERVRLEMAPFDHPALAIPQGHPADAGPDADGLAPTGFLQMPSAPRVVASSWGRCGRSPSSCRADRAVRAAGVPAPATGRWAISQRSHARHAPSDASRGEPIASSPS